MPLHHIRNFRVRQYECDANGHLNTASYLRYMQETAFDASAAAGYDMAAYQQLNSIWLIRETEIDYLHPLVYGDRVEVHTWVVDMRQVSSRRVYEFTDPGSQRIIARAHTDWAYIDADTSRPVKIPGEIAAAFFPEGLPDEFPGRAPFPTPPSPPEEVFSTIVKVRWSDIDIMEHVNNATYIDYMNECTMRMLASYGYSWSRIKSDGIGMYARKLRIKYHQPALLDDELEFSTWAYNMRRSTGIRYYDIHRASDNFRIAEIVTHAVWVDLSTGRPMRIPMHLLETFKPNIVW